MPMDAMRAILDRKSVPPRLMGDDGPSPSDVRDIIAAGMSAPDHGAVRPWRFVVVEGDNRAALGEVFAEALRRRDPNASDEAVKKELGRPLRAPTVIAILARIAPDHPKAPPVEQIVAVACAAQNMLLAAEARGFGGILLTGKNAQDPYVKGFFGLEEKDEIISFLYLGRPDGPIPDKPRPDPLQFVEPFGKRA